ncbi:inactive leucine-rich repeat receptor protein [Salix suchowensis]|nr:inactive leucine-rich repeat receptor protein [Salix suchowensis]
MKRNLSLTLHFIFFHILFSTKLSQSLTADGLSLLSLKSAVDQVSAGSAFSDWNEDDQTPCRWSGISCMNITGLPDPRVVGIAISGKNLRGYIPYELGTLIYLRRLNLHNNNFYRCKQLQRLVLAKNKFSGPIPAGIWPELDNLVQLDLSANDFNGSIPNDMGELKSLSNTLNLSFNHLSGRIPKSLGNLPVTSQNSAPVSDNSPKNGLSPGLIILISVADAAGVAFLGLVIVYIYWKKKDDSNGCSCAGKSKFGGNEKSHLCSLCYCSSGLRNDDSELEDQEKAERGKPEGELVAIDKGFTFELDELLRASAYVLGRGGEQRYKEFVTEAQAIGKVKHPNVVKLRAYYWAPDEKLLISDFISNGNLANALRGKNGQPSTSLSWSTRLRIAKGTARGLAYLHECSPRKFVHGDVKPSNILLDNEFQPYISDFGLNRLISITGNNPSSSGGFMGGALPYLKSTQTERTNNYRAPEARVSGNRPTQKWDVYSLGIVLLELLTGKSPELSPTTSTSVEITDLVRWVRKGFEEEKPLSDMVDPMLLQEVHAKKEVIAVFHVALACTEADSEVRPRMKIVSENLERIGK